MIDPSKPIEYVETWTANGETSERAKEVVYFGLVHQKGSQYHAVRITGSKTSAKDQWIGLFWADDKMDNCCRLQGHGLGNRFIRNFERKPNDWI